MQNDDKHLDPEAIGQLLNDKQALQPFVKKARQLQQIEQQLLTILPSELQDHCHVMNVKDNTLVVSVDNAALATRLRFYEPELLKQLKTFSALKVRVR